MALSADAIQVGLSAFMAPADYRRRISEGQGSGLAMAGATNSAAQTVFLSIPTSLILPLIPAAARGLITFAGIQNNLTRQRATPFSHRYEASAMASQMQQYSLGRMSEMQGLGNEAKNYNGRYNRG